MNRLLTCSLVAALTLLGTGNGIPQGSVSIATTGTGATRAPSIAHVPETPRATIDTDRLPPSDRSIRVPADGDLQAAIDSAAPGDRLLLEPGAVYRGPFHLPRKDGDRWIVIMTAAVGTRALPEDRPVTPADAVNMPTLVAASDAIVSAAPGAHHYRFVGIAIAPVTGATVTNLVQLGDGAGKEEALPHHIIFDRCYLRGDPTVGTRRGIAMNSRETAVVNSYLSDFKHLRADSQAIASWNGTGPFKIVNNYLEAAGENVMFGGADPTIPGLVPADIEVRQNRMAKPTRWMVGHATFGGTEWAIKNLLELKNARRVLIDGNLFEYNWAHAQNGFAILFTVRNQDGGSPWSTVEDLTFVNNLVRHVGAGINILGRDDNHVSERTSRIAIRNNLFLDIGGQWGNGRLFQLLDGSADVSIDHNTAMHTGSVLFGGDHAAHTGFVFENNIVPHNEHGITGSGTGVGTESLQRYFPMARVRRNIIAGGSADRYPSDNYFPPSLAAIGLTAAEGRMHLTLSQPYLNAATDGRDPGADLSAIENALSTWLPHGLTSAAPTDQALVPTHSPEKWPSRGSALLAFWASLLLLGYIYVGYPIVADIRSRLHSIPRYRSRIEPFVSVLVIAHNEGERIEGRIENLLALDYPSDRLEIIVGSDGSTDDTAVKARRYERQGVKLHALAERRGKAAAINSLVPLARGTIIMFADARQRFAPDAVRELVGNFADPTIGGVSGELVLTATRGAAAAGQGTAFYWRYEKLLRSTESQSGSTVGATGAIYAIRRELFQSIPEDTILDDVLIPMRIVRRGYRVIFESRARAYDAEAATASGEFTRKTRTIAGNFQLFAREPWLLNPWRNRLWFETVSHKALRLTIPGLHIGMLAGNLAIADSTFYQWVLMWQGIFYGAALAGWATRRARRRLIVLTVPYTMCLLGWATIVGFVRFVIRHQQVTWERGPAQRAPTGHLGRAA